MFLFFTLIAIAPVLGAETNRQEKAPALAVREMLQQLALGDWVLQSEAMAFLADWNASEGIEPLMAILKSDKDPWLRGQALIALTRMLGDGMKVEIAALAGDKTAELREAAVEALEILNSASMLDVVKGRLTDTNSRVRYRAAIVYARLRGKDAWKDLAGQFEAPDRDALRLAAKALGSIGTAQSWKKIQDLLSAEDAPHQIEILYGLGDLKDPEIVRILLAFLATQSPDSGAARVCRNTLESYGADFLAEPLASVFVSGDARLYGLAAGVLSVRPSVKAGDALEAVLKNLKDPSDAVVLASLDALGSTETGPERHRDLFARYLRHTNALCRAKAVSCLSLCPKADLFALLGDLVADEDPAVVRATLMALNRKTAESLPREGIVAYLEKVFQWNDPEILRQAFSLAKNHGTTQELDKAMSVMNRFLVGENDQQREAAAKALQPMAGENGAARVSAAQDYIAEWTLIGTFPSDAANSGYTNVFPPETEMDFKKKYQTRYRWGSEIMEREIEWRQWRVDRTDGKVVLHEVMPPPSAHVVAYGAADITAQADRTVILSVEADDFFVLWLNGEKLLSSDPETLKKVSDAKYQPTVSRAQLRIKLGKGRNRFLVKSCNLSWGWWYRVRLAGDESPPSVPAKIQVKSVGYTTGELAWEPSQDQESGVASYKVYRDAVELGTVKGTSYVDNSLKEGGSYSYQVTAVNTLGMESPKSEVLRVSAMVDSTPPVVRAVSSAVDPAKVVVFFSEPVEKAGAVNAANYRISRDVRVLSASQAANEAVVSLAVSGLSTGVTYTLAVGNVRDKARTPNVIVAGSQSAFQFLPAGRGLTAEYFNNMNFSGRSVVTRIDPQINFNWGHGSPDPAVHVDEFCARWTGKVRPDYSEVYTFHALTDDGIRLWVDNKQIIDQWVQQAPTETQGSAGLEAGVLYDIKMEYYDVWLGAVTELRWSSPSTPRQVIPQVNFYPVDTERK